VAVLGKE